MYHQTAIWRFWPLMSNVIIVTGFANTFLNGTLCFILLQLSNISSNFNVLSFSTLFEHVVRDLSCSAFNREGILQVLKPFKSKFMSKNHVPLRKVFADSHNYLLHCTKEHVLTK